MVLRYGKYFTSCGKTYNTRGDEGETKRKVYLRIMALSFVEHSATTHFLHAAQGVKEAR